MSGGRKLAGVGEADVRRAEAGGELVKQASGTSKYGALERIVDIKPRAPRACLEIYNKLQETSRFRCFFKGVILKIGGDYINIL